MSESLADAPCRYGEPTLMDYARNQSRQAGRRIPWFFWVQVYVGAAHFVIAADFAAIDGGLARELHLPMASVAERAFLVIPIIALLPCFWPRRIPAWLRVIVCDTVILGPVGCLPTAIVAVGSRSLPVSNVPPMSSPVLEVEPGVPVAFVSDRSGWRAVYPRSQETGLIRSALLRHGIKVRP